MNNKGPRHLLRPPRAFGRAAGFGIVILLALWVALAELQGLRQVGAVLLVALVGVLGMAAMLRVDHRFMDLVDLAGFVLAVVSVLLTLRSEAQRNDQPVAATSTTTTSTTTTSTVGRTTVETTVPVAPSTTAPTTTSAALPTSTVTTAPPPTPEPHHLLWIGVQPPRCLTSTSPTAGSSVQVAVCDDTIAMNWQVLSNGQIRGGEGDKCLRRLGTGDRDAVITATCDANREEQLWSWDGDRLVNRMGSYLDVDSRGDGRTVQVWEADQSLDQLWSVG